MEPAFRLEDLPDKARDALFAAAAQTGGARVPRQPRVERNAGAATALVAPRV